MTLGDRTRLASLALVTVALIAVHAAAAATQSVTEPIVEKRYNACTDEFVLVTGTRHMSVTLKNDFDVMIHTNWQNTTAVGLSSGNRYEANEVSRTYIVDRRPGVATVEDILELVSLERRTPNMLLRATTTFDFVTPGVHTDFEVECSGQVEPLPFP